MFIHDDSQSSIHEKEDILNEILSIFENESFELTNNSRRVKIEKNNQLYRSAPYLNNPLFHELFRGKENKLSDLNKSIPTHLLAKIAHKRELAPSLWKKLWTERTISDVMKHSNNEEKIKMEKLLVTCIAGESGPIIFPEKYFPISDWSYYIWWLLSRRPELAKLSPKLPGHVITAIASIEWKLLPETRPDILNDFISSVNKYKMINPPPSQIEKSYTQREYFKNSMKDLRSGIQDSFSEWLLPYLRSKKIQTEILGGFNSIKGINSGVTKGTEITKNMPVENIPNIVCRDIDRSHVRKKGHVNLVPTHLFPHSNSSDCCLQNHVYQNVFIEEYSNVIWSLISSLPKIDIKKGTSVQFVFKSSNSTEILHWVTGEIDSISTDTGEMILKSNLNIDQEEQMSITTSLNNFLPPSIPCFYMKEKWWRLLPTETTSKDIVPGSIVVYKSKEFDQKLFDGVIVNKSNIENSTNNIRIRRLFDEKCEEIEWNCVTNRISYDIHPIDGNYDTNDSLSSWIWCIPRPFQGENYKSLKGKLLLWFVSAEIDIIKDDPLLCVSIQQDIPFNHGYIWGPLPITCFIDIQNSNLGTVENSFNIQDTDSILDTPLSLLV